MHSGLPRLSLVRFTSTRVTHVYVVRSYAPISQCYTLAALLTVDQRELLSAEHTNDALILDTGSIAKAG